MRRIRRGVMAGNVAAMAGDAAPRYAERLYARYVASEETAGAVAQWDDQSGNGRHAVQATGANQPIAGTTLAGMPRLRFDRVNDHFNLDAAFSLSARNFSVFVVRKPFPDSSATQAFLHQPAGATQLGLFVNAGSVGPGDFRIFETTNRQSAIYAGHGCEVVCFRGAAAASRVIHGRETAAMALLANIAPTGGWLGAWNSGGVAGTNWLSGEAMEVRVYNGLSTAEEEDVFAELAAAYGALNRSADLFAVFEGDSTTYWGLTNDANAMDNNWPEQAYQFMGTLKGRMKYVNSGVGGQRLLTQMNNTNIPEFHGAMFTQNVNYPKHTAFLLAGVNDIHNAATLSQMEAGYADWATRIRSGAGAQGAGIKLGIGTITPNNFANQSVQTAVRTSVRANWASWGFDYLADFAADARLANTGDTSIYADGTHMTRAGELIKAEIWHTAALAAGAV